MIGLGETIAFWILGPLALAGGLAMVFARNAVHSALWLAQAMLCLGAMYMVEQAPFLGFVQIIVYTGAIMMLFLFVLMLVARKASTRWLRCCAVSGSRRHWPGSGWPCCWCRCWAGLSPGSPRSGC